MSTTTNIMTASNQWATRPADQRFETLAALRDSVHARRLKSRSMDVDLNRVHVTLENDRIAVNSVIAPSEPSHWSFSQFAGLLKAPAAYLRTLPKPLLVDCLNAGIERGPRAAPLAESALRKASRICHSTGSNNGINHRTGKPSALCRGARDVQLRWFHGSGFLSEPTDQAWNDKVEEMKARGKR